MAWTSNRGGISIKAAIFKGKGKIVIISYEVGKFSALLIGPDGEFITGSDFLIDGGVTTGYWFGELSP